MDAGRGRRISVAFGVLVALQPMLGALSLVFVIGAYAIIYGIALVALAFRLRGHSHPAPASTT